MIKVIRKHKHKFLIATILVTLSFVLSNCYESSSEVPPPHVVIPAPVSVGVAVNGAIYYQNRCATCHRAGQEDITAAFGAVDLARRQDMITKDMSNFDQVSGYNLMGTFKDVPKQRVADLKAYLKSVP